MHGDWSPGLVAERRPKGARGQRDKSCLNSHFGTLSYSVCDLHSLAVLTWGWEGWSTATDGRASWPGEPAGHSRQEVLGLRRSRPPETAVTPSPSQAGKKLPEHWNLLWEKLNARVY